MDSYEGGIVLRNEEGTASASVEVTAKHGTIILGVATMGDRGAGSINVNLTAAEMLELAGALAMANEAVIEFENRAGGVR